MGIGDWAQSPIPNPQSPIPNPQYLLNNQFNFYTYFYLINNQQLINLNRIKKLQ